MNVLSLFDGMGCAKLALNDVGIQVNKYYSSEVDKYSMGVSKFLHTDSIQLGDVTQWESWQLPKISILIGGSPCQGFSFAGKQKGMSTNCKIEITTLEQYQQLKSEGFEFNGQSYLFWEYVDILKTLKPKYFLLENVVMTKKWQHIITNVLGVEPILINSSLVSAQNRRRLYWCNWHVEQPEDKGILLKDIIDHSVNNDSHILSDRAINRMNRKKYSKPQINPDKTGTLNTKNNSGQLSFDSGTTLLAVIKNRGELQERNDKSMRIDANYHKGADNHGQRTQVVVHPCELRDTVPTGECHHIANALDIKGHDSIKRVYADSGTLPTVNTCTGGNREVKILNPASIVGRRLNDKGKREDYNKNLSINQCLQVNANSDKSRCLTTVEKDCLVSPLPHGRYPNAYTDQQLTYRKLTPIECERLQTVQDDSTRWGIINNKYVEISNSQRYKMLGNGFNMKTIAHILRSMPK